MVSRWEDPRRKQRRRTRLYLVTDRDISQELVGSGWCKLVRYSCLCLRFVGVLLLIVHYYSIFMFAFASVDVCILGKCNVGSLCTIMYYLVYLILLRTDRFVWPPSLDERNVCTYQNEMFEPTRQNEMFKTTNQRCQNHLLRTTKHLPLMTNWLLGAPQRLVVVFFVIFLQEVFKSSELKV